MGSKNSLIKLGILIDELGYDFSKFDIHHFTKWIAERRKRPIYLKPWKFTRSIFGAWLPKDDFDLIYYEPDLSEVHTIHILLHELSHMLLNHVPIAMNQAAASRFRTLGDSDPAVHEQAIVGLCRSIHYSDNQETEAETLSALIQTRVFRMAGLAALTHTSRRLEMKQLVEGMRFNQ